MIQTSHTLDLVHSLPKLGKRERHALGGGREELAFVDGFGAGGEDLTLGGDDVFALL